MWLVSPWRSKTVSLYICFSFKWNGETKFPIAGTTRIPQIYTFLLQNFHDMVYWFVEVKWMFLHIKLRNCNRQIGKESAVVEVVF